LNVVLSVTGNTGCRPSNGRNAISCPAAFVVVNGTGAPERMNRGPMVPGRMGLMAGHALPSFGDRSGLLPESAVEPPLDAKNAYARAPQIAVGFPVPTSVLIYVACAGVIFVKVRATGLSPGITGIVAELVKPCATLLVKNP